jgi:hypothetical protein
MTPVKHLPEAPRDPKLGIDAGNQRWARRQSPADLPHADDDERGDERVAEGFLPGDEDAKPRGGPVHRSK